MDEDDKVVDDYLKGKSPLSKIYKHTKREECPEEVSDYILSEARKSIKTKPHDFKQRNDLQPDNLVQPAFKRGSATQQHDESKGSINKLKHDWSNLVPISIAAMLMISIGIFTLMPQQIPEHGDPSITFRGGNKNTGPEVWHKKATQDVSPLAVSAIDCTIANTVQEKAICSNAPLKAFDNYLNKAYAEVRGIVPADLFDEVKKSQIAWIRDRDKKCGGNVPCLMEETRLRTAALNGFVQVYTDQLWQNSEIDSQAPGITSQRALSPKEVYSTAAESVVVVVAFNEGEDSVSQGSGVTIDQGVVATNCHVVGKAKNTVVLYKGLPYEVKSLLGDDTIDYCVLFVESLPAKPAVTAELETVTPGQRVYSVGSPRGLNLTIAEGLVSGFRTKDALRYIQTTAAISSGSSGGGLFDEYGRVIGITTFQLKESQNLNFALPVGLSKLVLKSNSD